MLEKIGRYFGFGPSLYEAEGWLSWQHLVFVTIMICVTVFLALFFANKTKSGTREQKLKVLKVASIVMISLESIKIILNEFNSDGSFNFWAFRSVLPLFLCSILLISLPIAAFGKGRIQEAALDFTMIFGFIACIAGTYLAANIFESPILSFHVNVSVTTHCISGFAATYVLASKLASMKKENIWIVCCILLVFELLAFCVNQINLPDNYESNYMFLTRDSGTPFTIVTSFTGGIQILYTLCVMLIYFAYLGIFEGIYFLIKYLKTRKVK